MNEKDFDKLVAFLEGDEEAALDIIEMVKARSRAAELAGHKFKAHTYKVVDGNEAGDIDMLVEHVQKVIKVIEEKGTPEQVSRIKRADPLYVREGIADLLKRGMREKRLEGEEYRLAQQLVELLEKAEPKGKAAEKRTAIFAGFRK